MRWILVLLLTFLTVFLTAELKVEVMFAMGDPGVVTDVFSNGGRLFVITDGQVFEMPESLGTNVVSVLAVYQQLLSQGAVLKSYVIPDYGIPKLLEGFWGCKFVGLGAKAPNTGAEILMDFADQNGSQAAIVKIFLDVFYKKVPYAGIVVGLWICNTGMKYNYIIDAYAFMKGCTFYMPILPRK